jgi:steroid 5-alpha reductase family enzyme
MWKTVLLLIFTLIVVPTFVYFFGEPLNNTKQEMLKILVSVYVGFSLFAFVVSTLTKNYSQVDKLWSTLPILYVALTAYHFPEPRVILMAVLAILWGLRLSYNFGRKGGFQWKFWEGEEDYRWEVLRQKPEFQGTLIWMIFNLAFISFYQLGLVLLMTLPIVEVIGSAQELYWLDYLIAILFVGFLAIETVADEQQWAFQTKKYALKNAGKVLPPEYAKGFLDRGLWKWMRHPNYMGEQAVWFIFYLFTIASGSFWLNWSVIGSLLLLVLFRSSSEFSEDISESKYPEYAEYRRNVGRFLPNLW